MTPDAPALDPSAYAPVIRHALRRLGVPTHAIDDAMQDVFTVVVRRDADFDRSRSMTNWLWGIARGVASTHRRSRARRARLHDALRVERQESLDAEDLLARDEATRRIERFIGSLSSGMREVFVLAHVHGHTGPEIAERLGINLNTAYARIRATRLRFEAEVVEPQSVGFGARFMRMFAPWFGAATQQVATATLSASLVWVGATAPIEPAPEPAAVAHSVEHIEAPAVPQKKPAPAKEGGMRTKPLAAAATLAVALIATPTVVAAAPAKAKPAKAATADDGDADDAARKTTAAGATYYDFVEGDRAEGLVLKPTGEQVSAHGKIKFQSLITIRSHFMPELVRTARDL